MTMTTRRLLFSGAFLALAAHGLAAQQPVPPTASQPALPAAMPPGQGLPRVTLREALRLAAQNQPAMVQARQDIRVAGWGARQALGAFLPTLSSSVSGSQAGSERYNATTGQRVINPFPYSESYGLSSRLNLFTGFQRGANRRSAAATQDLREATLQRQDYAIALSTKQAFFTALATAELVTVAETQLRRSDEQLRLASEKLRLGATTRSDSLRARVDYGNSQLQLIQARANLQYALANLGRVVGANGQVAPIPDSTLEARLTGLDTAALRREARANAPSVRESDASLAAARAALGASRAQWMPTVLATWSQNWSRSTSAIRDTIPWLGAWNVGISLSYPIFNGFQRETAIATAEANVIATTGPSQSSTPMATRMPGIGIGRRHGGGRSAVGGGGGPNWCPQSHRRAVSGLMRPQCGHSMSALPVADDHLRRLTLTFAWPPGTSGGGPCV